MLCSDAQAQQRKATGLPDPAKREGPIKTAQEIYEESGIKVRAHALLPAMANMMWKSWQHFSSVKSMSAC